MNYKIAVCDDSAADRQYLSALAAQWAEKAGAVAEVQSFPRRKISCFVMRRRRIMTSCFWISKWGKWTV